MQEQNKYDEVQKGRDRVLLVAYSCSPYRGSEPGMGWRRATETAKYFDTWVICKREKYENDIRHYCAMHGEIAGLHFHFLSRTLFERVLKRIRIPGFWYIPYNLWHRRAGHIAKELHKQIGFDLCHQVNMIGYREPGYLWKLNIPFVWGPIGGTENAPWCLLQHAGVRGAIVEGARNIINNLQLRFSLRVRRAAKKAALILTANSDGKVKFKKIHNVNAILFPNTGITEITKRETYEIHRNRELRILWSGRLEHNKCLPLLLKALSGINKSVSYELRITGDGPQKERWRLFCQRIGIEKHCKWFGWLSYEDYKAQHKWADVFVFTSLRDALAHVVLEALSYSLPVICLDHSGSHDVITEECGIKIRPTKGNDVVSALRQTILTIAEDRAKLVPLSRGAIKRAQNYLWSENGKQMAELYNKLLTSQI